MILISKIRFGIRNDIIHAVVLIMFLEQFQALPDPLLSDLFLRILFIKLSNISHPQHTSLNIANFRL